eukprot:TRINITY_DN34350_c0_g1_i1.p1 TRINITY_DN34350_c0_g1~~TRINITY_DN34350_c0_g1_i1.p1  ORF type:complete len:139 (-),score=8.00 TRINITY_DN34350_c0_g1_i1:144-560(-)
MALKSLLLTVVLVLHASALHVTIDGEDASGNCFTTTGDGLTARVSGTNVVVYDPDAPCPGGGSYIHYAGREFAPMTAGEGPLVHTYHAGIFPPDMGIVAVRHTGQCSEVFNRNSPGQQEVTWQVAAKHRGGACRNMEL